MKIKLSLAITFVSFMHLTCMEWTNPLDKTLIKLDNKWAIDREYMVSVLISTNNYFEKTKAPQTSWSDQVVIHFFASCPKEYHKGMLDLLVTEKVTDMKHIESMATVFPDARKHNLCILTTCEQLSKTLWNSSWLAQEGQFKDQPENLPFIHKFFVENSEYASLTREQLEKIVKETVSNNIDLNKREEIREFDWAHDANSIVGHKATLLGYSLFQKKHDSSRYVLADILVSNGAKLSGSYDNKFAFYFIKKISDWPMTNYDIRTPTTKLFETLLYRRVQYCAHKSKYIYLIANRIKNKTLYPQHSSAIPKFVLDHIAHFIISEGVSDVMNVCNEEASNLYKEDKPPYTMLHLWKKWAGEKILRPRWKPELKPLDAQEWNKDFNEFIQKKRTKDWQPGNSNLIIRSLRYKQGALYQDSEFTEKNSNI